MNTLGKVAGLPLTDEQLKVFEVAPQLSVRVWNGSVARVLATIKADRAKIARLIEAGDAMMRDLKMMGCENAESVRAFRALLAKE